MKPLSGQIALVTGAGSGIGRAIALALGREGASLVLVGRRRAPLDEVAAELAAFDVAAHSLPIDLAEADYDAMVTEASQQFGGIDILVHSAGRVAADENLATGEESELLYRVNALAPQMLTRAAVPWLKERRGQVVFVNSSAALAAPVGMTRYADSKQALRTAADALRAELNPLGIRVLSVFPGQTATPAQQRLYSQRARAYHPERLLQPGDIAAIVTAALTLPRTAEVTDLHVRPMIKPE